MATQTYTPNDIPDLERRISSLKGEADTYQSNLDSSPTALGGSGTPTSFDVSNQESLQRIQKEIQGLTDSKLRAQWYTPRTQDAGATSAGGGEVSSGLIGRTLDFLARPLYGVAGATKHVLGQGEGNLYQDIADNMVRNKNTFSDVLRSSGAPGAIAAPLGFALDVAMDPVNWATMGTGAIVPRLGAGIIRGAKTGEGVLQGLSLAAKSSALEKAAFVGRYTPGFRKTETFAKLGNRAVESTQAWEKFSGITAADLIMQKGMGIGSYRVGLGDVINRVADATPGGNAFLDTLWYDPKEWIRQARIKDVLQRQLAPSVDLSEAVNAWKKGDDMSPYMRKITEQITSASQNLPKSQIQIDFDSARDLASSRDVDEMISKAAASGVDVGGLSLKAPEMVNGVDDAFTVLKNPTMVTSSDPIENAVRIANETIGGNPITLEEIEKVVKSGALNETGVKWFDNMMSSMRGFEKHIGSNANNIVVKGKQIMDVYDQSMGIFRVSKIGLSPTAYVNAVVGNMIMTHMANGDIGPGFLKTLKLSFDMYRNKPGAALEIQKLLQATPNNPEMLNFFEDFKTAARGTFGSLDFLDANANAEKILRKARDKGIVAADMTVGDIIDPLNEAMDELAILKKSMSRSTETKAGTSMAREAAASGGSNMDKGTGMLSNELFSTTASTEMFLAVEKKARENPGHLGWKLLNATMNTLPSNYEKIDQTYKLTTFLRATTHGYTVNQLRQMRHIIDISPEELAMGKYINKERGEILYKLSPKTALELANEMYLNYNAMPAAVRVLRNFPLLGSPFVSFMYGMSLKTAQTLAYNPASFNKVTFAMNDFGGTKTPLEKKALSTEFYSYLKQPGMFRMPFFEENPVYLNMASMIPYYSLNMFAPTQTTHGDSVREKLVQAVQGSPLMKDPVGAALFDFMIQPLILGEDYRPQGQFGQPLYPVDAGLLEKTGYGARTLAEAYVPNVAAYAGLLPGSQNVADFVPSYRFRSLARAKEGQNQLGISGKEPAMSRTIREILKATGVSVQAPVNTTFSQSGN